MLRFADQICDAMCYLHDNRGIYHRDLRAANILLDENLNIKISGRNQIPNPTGFQIEFHWKFEVI